MTHEQQTTLARGRQIVALIDRQLGRAARILELEYGQSPAPNVEEDARLKALLHSFRQWAMQAREIGIDVESEFAKDLPNIKAALISTRKPIVHNPMLDAFLRGDLIEERPRPKPNPPSLMPLENWPP